MKRCYRTRNRMNVLFATLGSRRGAALTEYIVMGLLIGVFSIGSVTVFGDDIRALFSTADNSLAGIDSTPATRPGKAESYSLKGLKLSGASSTSGPEALPWGEAQQKALQQALDQANAHPEKLQADWQPMGNPADKMPMADGWKLRRVSNQQDPTWVERATGYVRDKVMAGVDEADAFMDRRLHASMNRYDVYMNQKQAEEVELERRGMKRRSEMIEEVIANCSGTIDPTAPDSFWTGFQPSMCGAYYGGKAALINMKDGLVQLATHPIDSTVGLAKTLAFPWTDPLILEDKVKTTWTTFDEHIAELPPDAQKAVNSYILATAGTYLLTPKVARKVTGTVRRGVQAAGESFRHMRAEQLSTRLQKVFKSLPPPPPPLKPLAAGESAELVAKAEWVSPPQIRVKVTARPDGMAEFKAPGRRGIAVDVIGKDGVQTYIANHGEPAVVPVADPLNANLRIGVTSEIGIASRNYPGLKPLQDVEHWQIQTFGPLAEKAEEGVRVISSELPDLGQGAADVSQWMTHMGR